MSEETKAKISNSHKGRHWYIDEDGKDIIKTLNLARFASVVEF